MSAEPNRAMLITFIKVQTATAIKYGTAQAQYAFMSGFDGEHLPFNAANARHLYDRMHSIPISIMHIGTKNTNSIGSEGAENTTTITLTCMPSEYDLYMHGAIDKNDSGRLKNSESAKTQYIEVDRSSKKKNEATPELPRRNENTGDLFRRIYSVLSLIFTPTAIPIIRNNSDISA